MRSAQSITQIGNTLTELGTADVESFLNDLVMRRRLSASSQNQALNALVFLYKHVLEDTIPHDHLGKFLLQRARRMKRVPTVLSVEEVRRVIEAIPPARIYRLMVELLYGTGMRVSEVCTLRVRDIDLGRAQIIVRGGKGDKDRVAASRSRRHPGNPALQLGLSSRGSNLPRESCPRQITATA